MEDRRINKFRLNERYFMIIDRYNFTLYEKRKITDPKHKKCGEYREVTIGFYSDFRSLLKALTNYNITVEADTCKTMEDILKKMDEFISGMEKNGLIEYMNSVKSRDIKNKKHEILDIGGEGNERSS